VSSLLFPTTRLHAEPIPFDQAAAYVTAYHRHNDAPTGHIFSVGCYYDGVLVGVAICGRPVGRKLDDGQTLEVYRVCTRGHKNACSKLYSACQKYARLRGYARLITYTLQSETAASVRASNFVLDAAKAGGKAWNGRTAFTGTPELKRRWVFQLKPATPPQQPSKEGSHEA
jgi:hypothetical protein